MPELDYLRIKLPDREPKAKPEAYIDQIDEYSNRYERLARVCKAARLLADFCRVQIRSGIKEPVNLQSFYLLISSIVTFEEFDNVLDDLEKWGILKLGIKDGVRFARWEPENEV